MNFRMIISTLVVLIALSSCVSKKQFLAMQDDYTMKTDSLVSVTEDLNSKILSGESDFESTKQDFLVNDAAKNDKIAGLETQIKELQLGFDEVTRTLSDTESMVKMSQNEKDQASYQLARMNSELVRLRQDTVSLNYAIKLQKRKSSGLQQSLDQQISKYTKESNEHRTELSSAKKDVEANRLKTKELERQLALKQKQMDDVNSAFVELRKDMLRSSTQGKIIDPNNNANVNKLAKSLGQY